MKKNYAIELISGYKIIVASIRIILGVLILQFRGNLKELALFLFNRKLKEEPHILFKLVNNIINAEPINLALVLAFTLIIFSIIELIFSIGLLYRKKSSVIGLFVISLLWIPVEILFISKFLFIHKVTALIINLLISAALLKIIINFRKHRQNPYEIIK